MSECPYCGSELVQEDTYFKRDAYGRQVVLGDILRCPNHQGFSDENQAIEYANETGQNVKNVVCDSSVHHVSGSFYTDTFGNLHNGYPC